MNIDTFEKRLAESLVDAINCNENKFNCHRFKSFNLGIYPWHGFIELSFMIESDASESDVASWKFFNFCDREKFTEISNWMKDEWLSNHAVANKFYAAAARAVESELVTIALSKLNQEIDFYVQNT
jgi:hypothetical protein